MAANESRAEPDSSPPDSLRNQLLPSSGRTDPEVDLCQRASKSPRDLEDELKVKLNEDVLGCDLQLSLFYCAAFSYRFESILKPFPPMFNEVKDGDLEKDVDLLVSECYWLQSAK